jgi:uncharacterized protein (TIGR03067 family)
MRIGSMLVLAAGLLVVPARAGAAKDPLDGTDWTVVSATLNGKSIDQLKGDEYQFKSGGLTIKNKGKETRSKYQVDGSKKPAHIDITGLGSKTVQGVFKTEGDTLTICVPELPGGKRPAAFQSKAGSKTILLVLKRKKK